MFIKLQQDHILRQRSAVIIILCLFCLALTFWINIHNHVDIVYTHFFYLPIILAGLWFGGTAFWLGSLLGCLHIYTNYLIAGNIVHASIYRAAFFVFVAIIVDFITNMNASAIEESQPLFSEEDPSRQRGALGNMVVAFGHEIRNPMTTVKGYMQLLQEQKGFEEHQETFAMIIEDIDRANATLHQCMSLSPQKLLHFQTANLNEVIQTSTAYHLFPQAAINDIGINLDLCPVPDFEMDIDEVSQLVIHIVQNAIEASPHQGTIFIRTSSDDNIVTISIKDQGNGFSPDLLAELGRPFITTKPDHAGLGLAVSHSIAMRHHASINIKHTTEGTCVEVHFPIIIKANYSKHYTPA